MQLASSDTHPAPRRKRRSIRRSALAAAAAEAFVLAAHAQAPPAPAAASAPTAAASAAAGPSQGIQTVVVTAEHRVADVQKTSIAITAVSGEQAREKGQTNLAAVLEAVPALDVQGSPQGGQVFIRGVGANGDSNWVDPAVSLNFDGIYSGRAERVFASMYDVNRVEVLRGPQGTLYGRNATGGSVNIVTNDPGRKFEGDANVQVGNYHLFHEDAAVTVPLGEMLSSRVALMREQRDGYFTNGGRASDLKGARLKVLYKPSADFSLLATADDLTSTGKGATTVPRPYDDTVPPFVNWSTDYANPWRVDPVHPADLDSIRFDTLSLQADWNLGFGTLSLVPSYTHSKRVVYSNLILGDALAGSGPALGGYKEDQYTGELRLSSPVSSAIKWVAGAYGFKSDNRAFGSGGNSGTALSYENYGVKVPATSRALFGQATVPVAEGLRATAGLRFTKDDKTNYYGIKSIAGSYDSGLQDASNRYSAITYKAGLEYDVARESMAYAQVASGYKAGGFSTTAIPPVAYKPEHLTAFELGSKNRFLDDTVQVNAEAYLYKYRDYQVQYADYSLPSPNPEDAAGTTVFSQLVSNADTGTNYGLEIESRWRFIPTTELHLTGTYTHARYGNFETASLSYMNGMPVASTPKWQVLAGIEHQIPFDSGADLTLGVDTKFSAGYRVGVEHDLPGGDLDLYQGRFHKTDLRASYDSADGKWLLGLWVRNLENDAQTTEAQPFGRNMISDPRSFGMNATYRF